MNYDPEYEIFLNELADRVEEERFTLEEIEGFLAQHEKREMRHEGYEYSFDR